ncbi:DUF4247 domain-containing protein [Paenibacillus thalictri]|uniref:DUF4247 domain-containing protein n=1 Tax=Paenibacillus thalictri TaxID=2527873 RepID=UPI00269FAAD0
MSRLNRWVSWIACTVIFTLLVGCTDAGSYVKETYPLVDVQGTGKNTAKVYVAEGKNVPTAAKEIASKEKPQEISKESTDQMFLVYKDKIVNVHKDPSNESNSLVEMDTVEYAKEHYDSSFLQGYITASLLQSVLGGGWFNSRNGNDYRGYTPPASSSGSGQRTQTPTPTSPTTKTPTTSDRQGSFGSGSSKTTTPPSSSGVRKSDGSTPTYKAPSSGSSKPSTGSRSGSFTKRK